MPDFTMPIGLHLAVVFVFQLVGFLAACLGASYAMWAVGSVLVTDWEKASKTVGVPLALLSMAIMFTSAYGGIRAGAWLALSLLPARCPVCGGRSWGKGCKIITYTCESCAHEEIRRTERG